nr:MAG TPA: hypothetical protein [Caudoviricetes sp.]
MISGYSVRETPITDALYPPWISRFRDLAVCQGYNR